MLHPVEALEVEVSEIQAVGQEPIAYCWTCGFWNPEREYEPLGLRTRTEADYHAGFAHEVATRSPKDGEVEWGT